MNWIRGNWKFLVFILCLVIGAFFTFYPHLTGSQALSAASPYVVASSMIAVGLLTAPQARLDFKRRRLQRVSHNLAQVHFPNIIEKIRSIATASDKERLRSEHEQLIIGTWRAWNQRRILGLTILRVSGDTGTRKVSVSASSNELLRERELKESTPWGNFLTGILDRPAQEMREHVTHKNSFPISSLSKSEESGFDCSSFIVLAVPSTAQSLLLVLSCDRENYFTDSDIQNLQLVAQYLAQGVDG